MPENQAPADADAEIDDVIRLLGDRPFSSKEFIDVFSVTYPQKWEEIVLQYGIGGRGSGNRYSSNGFIGGQLDNRVNQNKLLKLPRRPAPAGWGNSWIVVWRSVSGADKPNIYPDEVDQDKLHFEGHRTKVWVNRYERDHSARKKCIDYYKCVCNACGIDFREKYGEHGADFIHVHHLRPLYTITEKYAVDPIKDLRPVCPNCHAMIHYRGGLLSIDEIKALLPPKCRNSSD